MPRPSAGPLGLAELAGGMWHGSARTAHHRVRDSRALLVAACELLSSTTAHMNTVSVSVDVFARSEPLSPTAPRVAHHLPAHRARAPRVIDRCPTGPPARRRRPPAPHLRMCGSGAPDSGTSGHSPFCCFHSPMRGAMLACTYGVACTFVPIGTATLREKSAAAASLASFWWLRLSHLEGRFATRGGLGI